jgi:transposase
MNKTKQRKSGKGKSDQKIVHINALEQLNLNAAGIDVGSAEIYVAVGPERDEESVRSFGVFTPDLHKLAVWLKACRIDTVAMEATGIYWIALYEILEAAGFKVYLVNARHVKNVAGRKTDVLDCQWLQQLHTYGLLRASFRPDAALRTLRTLTRQRDMLIEYRSAHIQHMQKALRQMNVQLDVVLTDITGVTGQLIIRAIVAGDHDPKQLAHYRDPGCKQTQAEIEKALMGNYQAEHLFTLQQALSLYDTYGQKIAECEGELEKQYAKLQKGQEKTLPPLPPPTRRQKRSASKVDFDLRSFLYNLVGVDLTAIDGFGVLTAQTILAEIGYNMSKWPTVKHFASWLGLSPHDDISGGKVLRHKTKAVNSTANLAFRQAAQSVGKTQSALGAFYRRIKAKHGAAKANVATAHKLARTVYYMIKNQTPYHDPGLPEADEQTKQAMQRNLQRKAKKLGFQLTPIPA